MQVLRRGCVRRPPSEEFMTFSQFQEQFHISLDPQQSAAVQAVEGPVLLLAVPGS